MFLGKLEGIRSDQEIVIAYPSYLSYQGMQALKDAAKVARLNCVQVIPDHFAVAKTYGYMNKKQLNALKEPRVVCFINMGHSYSSVTFVEYNNDEGKILDFMTSQNLGARDFDYEMMKYLE